MDSLGNTGSRLPPGTHAISESRKTGLKSKFKEIILKQWAKISRIAARILRRPLHEQQPPSPPNPSFQSGNDDKTEYAPIPGPPECERLPVDSADYVPLHTDTEEDAEVPGAVPGIPGRERVTSHYGPRPILLERPAGTHREFKDAYSEKYGQQIVTFSLLPNPKKELGSGEFKTQFALKRMGEISKELEEKVPGIKEKTPDCYSAEQLNAILRNAGFRDRLEKFFKKIKEKESYKEYNFEGAKELEDLLCSGEVGLFEPLEKIESRVWDCLEIEKRKNITEFLHVYLHKPFFVSGVEKNREAAQPGQALSEDARNEILRVLQIQQRIDKKLTDFMDQLSLDEKNKEIVVSPNSLRDRETLASLRETLPEQESLLDKIENFIEGLHYVTIPSVCWDEAKQEFHLVTPLKSGSLLQATQSDQLSPEDNLKIMRDVARGLAFLHDDLQISHNDLAARNVLLFFGPNGIEASIADYGLATPGQTVHKNQAVDDFAPLGDNQPIRWLAPERILGLSLAKSDLWSFGCLCEEVADKERPLGRANLNDVVRRIRSDPIGEAHRKRDSLKKHREKLGISDDTAWETVLSCFSFSADDRPDYEKLFAALDKEWRMKKEKK